MKKHLLLLVALMTFASVACKPESKPGDDSTDPTEKPGENENPGDGGNDTPPADLTFSDYISETKAILYDDQWVPSAETITITVSGKGKENVDFDCTENPFQGSKCIKWVMNCPVGSPADFIRLTFDPLIDFSGYEKKGDYCVEFAIKTNWWITGNVFNVQLRDSKNNVDGKPYLYQQNAIQDFDEDTPVTDDSPEGTIPPGNWHRVSIPLNQIWGINNDPEGELTQDDWRDNAKTTRNSTGSKWLPDLAGLGSLTFKSKASAKNPEETDLIVWIDEIQICKASFPQNK